MIRRWIRRWVGARVVSVPVMTERARLEALGVPENLPVWAAVMSVLEDHIADAQEITRAAQTATNPSLLAHQAGGLDALLGLREDLVGKRMEAVSGELGAGSGGSN